MVTPRRTASSATSSEQLRSNHLPPTDSRSSNEGQSSVPKPRRSDACIRARDGDRDELRSEELSSTVEDVRTQQDSEPRSSSSPLRRSRAANLLTDTYSPIQLQATSDIVRRQQLSQQTHRAYIRNMASRGTNVREARDMIRHRSNPPLPDVDRSSYTFPAMPTRTARAISQSQLNRSLPELPQDRNREEESGQDITLPRWQPDSEVSSCPICHNIFTFWYRKHHCRKCGRVVCANCSPHRITIPRPYIVRAPEDPVFALTTNQHHGVSESPEAQPRISGNPSITCEQLSGPATSQDPALGGGQEVRLCNPCVPDPNPTPFATVIRNKPQFGSAYRGLSRAPGADTGQNPSSSLRTRAGESDETLTSFAPFETSHPQEPGPMHDRRSHRAFRHSDGFPGLQYIPSPYGSAPDTSHKVSAFCPAYVLI